MSFLNRILKTFLGDKAQKDIKNIQPLVIKINQIQEKFEKISNDKLRAKTSNLKKQIKDSRSSIDNEILELKNEIETSKNYELKEQLYIKIDSLEEDAYKVVQDLLNEILPEAFAIIKETARRFKNNSTLESCRFGFKSLLKLFIS